MQEVEESIDGVSMSGYPGCSHPSKLMSVSQGGYGEAEVLSNPYTPAKQANPFDHPLFKTLPSVWQTELINKNACKHVAAIIDLHKLDKLQFFNTKWFSTDQFEKAIAYFSSLYLTPACSIVSFDPQSKNTVKQANPFDHPLFDTLPEEWKTALTYKNACEHIASIIELHKRDKLKSISTNYVFSGELEEVIADMISP